MVRKHGAHDANPPLAVSSQIDPVSSDMPCIISLPVLLDQPIAEPEWIVPGLLPTGVSLLAGPARVDKPLLANQLGLSVATGQPFLQHDAVRRGRVLYLALAESSVHVRGRAVSLLSERSYPDNFHLAFRWSPFRQGGLADLEDTIANLDEPRLIIVDPLEFVQPLRSETGGGYGFRQRQSSAAADAALTFFLPLRELAARYDLAILLLHHLPEDWPANRRDPLAGLSPTGLTAASACNLLLTPGSSSRTCELHIAGVNVAERRLRLEYDRRGGQWKVCEG